MSRREHAKAIKDDIHRRKVKSMPHPTKHLNLSQRAALITLLAEIGDTAAEMRHEIGGREFCDVSPEGHVWDQASTIAGSLASMAEMLWPDEGSGPIS